MPADGRYIDAGELFVSLAVGGPMINSRTGAG
jgi:hypothetical protein